MLRLYDTARQAVQPLSTRDEGRVAIYVCGPTVYEVPHLGHGRFSLVWDVARRWLTFTGLDVHYVSNITDVDDKIIAKAASEGVGEADVAARYEADWWATMARLGVARPDDVPHATAYVAEMVAAIEELLARGAAYLAPEGVYFDVASVPDYGLLAHQDLVDLRAGARVETSEHKRSPLDFALWKAAKPGEPAWEAPFGRGRPGWHTECVVMSLGLLGEGFDLHCGGLDLKFPHHENERAQAEALGRPFARHWGHNGFVMVGEDKMSKSLGNFTTLGDLLATSDPRAYRLLVLRSHYRSPIEVSPATISDAERALARLDALARRFDLPALAGERLERRTDHPVGTSASAVLDAMALQMDDDLDTPGAVATLFEALGAANAAADRGEEDLARDLARAVAVGFGALGLALDADAGEVDDVARELAAERDAARAQRDWTRADQLRDELVTRGYVVEDGPNGTVLRRG